MTSAAEYVPYAEIVGMLPIERGGIYYVVSDILAIAKVCRDHGEKFDRAGFVASIQSAVGNDGTLLFPTYNWDFCKGAAFDYVKTKGQTGALGNIALGMSGMKRTQHPIYSIVVWGSRQKDFLSLENRTSFGKDSPFKLMHENKAKALIVGLTPTIGNTFLHYIENSVGVPYRYHKDFKGPYTDEAGKTEIRTYSMYVRDMNINPQHTGFAKIDGMMSALGICKDYKVNDVPFHIVDLCGMYDLFRLDIEYNAARNLYTY